MKRYGVFPIGICEQADGRFVLYSEAQATIDRLTLSANHIADDLAIAKYDGTKLRMIYLALGEEPIDLQEGQPGWSPEFHGVMELRKELAAATSEAQAKSVG